MSGFRDIGYRGIGDAEVKTSSRGNYILIGEKGSKQMRKHLTSVIATQRIIKEIQNSDWVATSQRRQVILDEL